MSTLLAKKMDGRKSIQLPISALSSPNHCELLQFCNFFGSSVAEVEAFMMFFLSLLLMLSCDGLIMMYWWMVGLQGGVSAGGPQVPRALPLPSSILDPNSIFAWPQPGAQTSLHLPLPISCAVWGNTGNCVFCRVSWGCWGWQEAHE